MHLSAAILLWVCGNIIHCEFACFIEDKLVCLRFIEKIIYIYLIMYMKEIMYKKK